ncbi:MAG: IS3 family transposase, partial [Dactylosporangium sp.]|nr:IS3 family transposase [Dactylosporangium sp.]
TSWRTREEAENALFEYIDGFYNPRRIQKELGYRSPDQYEAAYRQGALESPASPANDLAPAGAR